MFNRRHRSCSYFTSRNRKLWLSYGLPNTKCLLHHDVICSVEIGNVRMHPNTSVGFS